MAVRVEGAERMIAHLKGSGDLTKALTRVTVQVATTAKRLCPVDTGRLRSSIGFDVIRDERGLVGRVGSGIGPVSEPVLYAAFVEYGTRFMDAQPYLRPALTSVLGRLNGVGEQSAA
jgi:HK97 gp10 family phage protein